jgi:hypothetical protein
VSDSSNPTPRQRIEKECKRRGEAAVVAGCIALLGGRRADPELIVALGGPPARWAITGEKGGPPYWLRVWAARGLLYAWNDKAVKAVLAATKDDSWRVREMAVKVAARRRLDGGLRDIQRLSRDAHPRVREAALRACARLTDSA